jgi:hypothetical protein
MCTEEGRYDGLWLTQFPPATISPWSAHTESSPPSSVKVHFYRVHGGLNSEMSEINSVLLHPPAEQSRADFDSPICNCTPPFPRPCFTPATGKPSAPEILTRSTTQKGSSILQNMNRGKRRRRRRPDRLAGPTTDPARSSMEFRRWTGVGWF